MNSQRNSNLSLFLMELILAILFFSLSAAVCVRLFVSAHLLSENTSDLNNATIWSQNLAEVFAAENGSMQEIAEHFPKAYVTADPSSPQAKEGTIILFFDENWEMLEGSLTEGSYEAILNISIDDANKVYEDVNTYGVELTGKAVVGEISILNIKDISDVVLEKPEDSDLIILTNQVDAYFGKEGL